MSIHDLREKYGGNGKTAINRAIRAEVPGGTELLDLLELVAAMRLREAVPPVVEDRLRQIREKMADAVIGAKQSPRPREPGREVRSSPQAGEAVLIRAPKGDAPNGQRPGAIVASSQSPQPVAATPGLSLDLLRPSTKGSARDNREWTPPAVVVEQMGRISDLELSRLTGVSAQTIRRERERLGIAPAETDKEAYRWTPDMDNLLGTRPDGELAKLWSMGDEAVRRRREKLGIAASKALLRWTPEALAILDAEPDNARAVERLAAIGLTTTIGAVKVKRSRHRASLPAKASTARTPRASQ